MPSLWAYVLCSWQSQVSLQVLWFSQHLGVTTGLPCYIKAVVDHLCSCVLKGPPPPRIYPCDSCKVESSAVEDVQHWTSRGRVHCCCFLPAAAELGLPALHLLAAHSSAVPLWLPLPPPAVFPNVRVGALTLGGFLLICRASTSWRGPRHQAQSPPSVSSSWSRSPSPSPRSVAVPLLSQVAQCPLWGQMNCDQRWHLTLLK